MATKSMTMPFRCWAAVHTVVTRGQQEAAELPGLTLLGVSERA
ncbi:hypothetical protein [Mycobacterium colombiense]|nr:hypothetical protein [Mycobacterium colombiense]